MGEIVASLDTNAADDVVPSSEMSAVDGVAPLDMTVADDSMPAGSALVVLQAAYSRLSLASHRLYRGGRLSKNTLTDREGQRVAGILVRTKQEVHQE